MKIAIGLESHDMQRMLDQARETEEFSPEECHTFEPATDLAPDFQMRGLFQIIPGADLQPVPRQPRMRLCR